MSISTSFSTEDSTESSTEHSDTILDSMTGDSDGLGEESDSTGDTGSDDDLPYCAEREEGIRGVTQSDLYFVGSEMAHSGNVVVVGVPHADDLGEDSGAVLIFEGSGNGEYDLVQRILPPRVAHQAEFGRTIAVNGDLLAVSTKKHLDNSTRNTGLFIYRRSGIKDHPWELEVDVAKDIDAFVDRKKQVLGTSLLWDGEQLLVGAIDYEDQSKAGWVYILRQSDAGSWELAHRLSAPAPADYDGFGTSLFIDADRLFVGAAAKSNVPDVVASVYEFERGISESWQMLSVVNRPVEFKWSSFGAGVLTWNDWMFVYASHYSPGIENAGAVLVYRRGADGNWGLQQTLLHESDVGFHYYGRSLAIVGDELFVSHNGFDATAGRRGGVDRWALDSGGQWQLSSKLEADPDSDVLAPGFGSSMIWTEQNNLLIGWPGVKHLDNSPLGVIEVRRIDASGSSKVVQRLRDNSKRVVGSVGSQVIANKETIASSAAGGEQVSIWYKSLTGEIVPHIHYLAHPEDLDVRSGDFGHRIAFAKDSEILVSAPHYNSGLVRMYVREYGTQAEAWNQQAVIEAPAGAVEFGRELSANKRRAWIGSSLGVHEYWFNFESEWEWLRDLDAHGNINDIRASQLANSDEYVAIADPEMGKVHVYFVGPEVSRWSRQDELFTIDISADGGTGMRQLAMNDRWIAVSVDSFARAGMEASGSTVLLYYQDGGNSWVWRRALSDSRTVGFGQVLKMNSADRLLITGNSGLSSSVEDMSVAHYVVLEGDTDWTLEARWRGDAWLLEGGFGSSLAMFGNSIYVGAPRAKFQDEPDGVLARYSLRSQGKCSDTDTGL